MEEKDLSVFVYVWLEYAYIHFVTKKSNLLCKSKYYGDTEEVTGIMAAECVCMCVCACVFA